MRAPISDTMLACEEYLRKVLHAQKMVKKAEAKQKTYG